MRKILGLDLGTTSIGWGLIEIENDYMKEILGLGVRDVPDIHGDLKNFTKGKGLSANQKRTEKRTTRKGYDRYQQRRMNLTLKLRVLNMLPDEQLIKLPVLELWQLRANAATKGCKLSLAEIGRVLYHLNQKRGYKHAKADENSDKKQREYVANINNRYTHIQELGKTIGQYFFDNLKDNEVTTEKGKFYTYRIKDQVFPRKAYEAEYDQIMECQKEFYPDILTDEVIDEIRNEIIYYQRKLKSCKHLVSLCEFEKRKYINKEGKEVYDGPKVAPKSSPLFQVCKIWESVNNLTLKNRRNDELYISAEQRKAMFDFLNKNEKMTLSDMYKILNITRADGWWGGKAIGKGLQGNTTKMQLRKALSNIEGADELLKFDLTIIDNVDTETGEILKVVSPDFEKEPLYKLWHTIYSIQDKEELRSVLAKNFNITEEETINALFAIDFVKLGFGNKSSKFMRRILPYLQEGEKYSTACEYLGVNHSNSITTAENEARILKAKLPRIQKNELRQPVVEKILNQMVNVVNAIIDKYGTIDEIRVELARELKQSKDERKDTYEKIIRNQKKNEDYAKRIEEFGIRSSRNKIHKYKMWVEADEKCFYCGQTINVKEFLAGDFGEKEHIIPKSLYFDDSFSNKVCSCRKCNQEKNNRTAYDYMKTKGEEAFNEYVKRVERYYDAKKISKTKRERLLTPADKIPNDFIDRQLRESQYIARKSAEMLRLVCRNVWTTSGSVTDFLRHNWGYDEILHSINFERYQLGGLTEMVEFDHKGQKHTEERIKEWTKRLDHRHHAIDALVVACTRQSYIQRLNNLNTERDAMFEEVEKQSAEWKEKQSLLNKWVSIQPHFPVDVVRDKVEEILISFKSGKKVTTPGWPTIYKDGTEKPSFVPRGSLSEDHIYGKIKTIEEKKPIEYIFEHPDLIFKPYIKKLVEDRLKMFDGDTKKAIASLKKDPIYLREDKSVTLEYATCYKEEYVIKYPLTSIKAKDAEYIIDKKIKEIVKQRLSEHNNNEKVAFSTPLYADANNKIEIKTVRCFTGLSAVEPIKYNDNNEAIGYVIPGNNHHIAIYTDTEGNKVEHVVTFWHAVERKKYGIPVVITNPNEVWDKIKDMELPESFLSNLPAPNLKYELSMQQNEMFILGMSEDEYKDAIQNKDYKTLNTHLYKVQNISENTYRFCLSTSTQFDLSKSNKADERFLNIQSIRRLFELNPHKIKIDLLGKIVEV
ncbi:MAG: type II CRISPR RNA-guided endonuclease Cas9 [Bacteroidales bacterium]|nr:type II CRISPR RNA-guided endonuclease Cas9 [Bacteroidales bacterium]